MSITPVTRDGMAVLGISYERSPDAPGSASVRFVLEIDGHERVRLKVPEKFLGLVPPEVDSGSEASATTFVIPPEILGPFQDTLEASARPGAPLWLEFRSPSEDLPALFWEEVIQPAIRRPVVRLPYAPFQPLASPVPLDVVLLGSSPHAKMSLRLDQHLAALARAILGVGGVDVTVHLFADQAFYHSLKRALKDRLATGSEAGVVVYDPEAARRYGASERSSQLNEPPGVVRNPWLRWITDAMPEDRAADLVHFVGHGYRSFDNGAIALAPSPVEDNDRSWARFVGAQQMATFMTQVGAWGVGFSSPQAWFQAESLRLLADNLARVVPGPVCFHDLRNDPSCAALNELYRFLTSPGNRQPPASPRLSMYYHPPTVGTAGASTGAKALSSRALESVGGMRGLFSPGSRPPRWVAASQRAIERSAAELYHRADQESTIDPKTRVGAENAMRFVTELIGTGESPTSGDAMVHNITSTLGKTAEQIVSTYDPVLRAFTESATSDAPAPAGPVAALALNHYAKALDDARRLVTNLSEQRSISDDLKSSAKAVADELAVHVSTIESARRTLSLGAASESASRPQPKNLEPVIDVTKNASRLQFLIHELTDKFTASLTPPRATFPTAERLSSEGGEP